MGQKFVGPQFKEDGTTGEGRIGNLGDVIASLLHGNYYEQAKRGNLMMGATAVTGVAPGTAIGTTAAFSLYNPKNSPVDLVILKARLSYISGTLGIGVVNWVVNTDPTAAATSGTAITVVNGLLNRDAGHGKPLTTATLPATPTLARLAFNLPPMLATSVLVPWHADDDVDGAIIVAPGCTASLEGTAAAGTSPLVIFGCLYEEVQRQA